MYHGQIDVNRAVSYRSCVKSSIIKSLILLATGVTALPTFFASIASADFTPNWFVDFGTLNDPTCSNRPQTPKSVTVSPTPATFSNGLICGGNYEHYWHSSGNILPWPVKVRVDFSVPVYGLNVEGEGYGRIVYRDNFYTWIKDNGSYLSGPVWEPNITPYSFRSEDIQNGITFFEIYTDSKWCSPTNVTTCFNKLNIHKLNFTTTPPPSNLTVLPPRIDTDTGDLYVDYRVDSSIPFRPNGAYVPVEVWAGVDGIQTKLTRLGHWNLDPCVNKGNCFYSIKQPFSQREMVPREQNWMTNIIDPLNTYKEIYEWDNSSTKQMDDFYMEKIPAIMGNKGWPLAKDFLNGWYNVRGRIKNSVSSFDWSLPIQASVSTNWFLDANNANGTNWVIDQYNYFIKKEVFLTQGAKDVLGNRVRKLFQANPTASYVDLSKTYDSGISIANYHDQHINYMVAQKSATTLDAVSAAFGGFSFYVVPMDTATPTLDGTSYFVKFKEIAIHVTDSFDFNDATFSVLDPSTWISQALGCYSMPDVVKPPLSSGHCVSNSNFRWYRRMKVRGGDYNIFTTPIIVRLPQSAAFYVNK